MRTSAAVESVVSVETAHARRVRERPLPDGTERTGDAAVWVGVVHSPPGRFDRRVDASYPALGLSPETRETLERRRRDLRMQGLCAEGAHNAAWEELAVDTRDRSRLSGETSDEGREALASLSSLVEREHVVLATDRWPGGRCHRGVLSSLIGSD
ncbi:hypothetical protein C2R22_10430 [Salinigranum rubrum]|uniref:DUF488 domain-containing protein n=1 Tax=Salinigranum rubrum TaxID=755307 RepID=A0A2I8VJE0_9EURY|nr:hypothetical protein [Salinigranum rubrum]AUV82014.1 hypothetical protein C2R22_10430 [Salinigranum rubrum]